MTQIRLSPFPEGRAWAAGRQPPIDSFLNFRNLLNFRKLCTTARLAGVLGLMVFRSAILELVVKEHPEPKTQDSAHGIGPATRRLWRVGVEGASPGERKPFYVAI
jgi:hypothetical protein